MKSELSQLMDVIDFAGKGLTQQESMDFYKVVSEAVGSARDNMPLTIPEAYRIVTGGQLVAYENETLFGVSFDKTELTNHIVSMCSVDKMRNVKTTTRGENKYKGKWLTSKITIFLTNKITDHVRDTVQNTFSAA